MLAPPDELPHPASSRVARAFERALLHVDTTRMPVSGVSRRLRALAALSGSLADSLDPEDALSRDRCATEDHVVSLPKRYGGPIEDSLAIPANAVARESIAS